MARDRGIPDQDRPLERELLVINEPSSEEYPTATATMQKVQTTTKPGKHGQRKVETVDKKEIQSRRHRASDLRKKYPDMKNIPETITKHKRKQLIQKYEATKSALLEKSKLRGARSSAPNNTDLNKPGAAKGQKKKAAQNSANVPVVSTGTVSHKIREPNRVILAANLPARPPAPAQKQVSRRPQLTNMPNGTSHNPHAVYQPTNKMASLSEARRAEVARNLKGFTHDDPIAID